jgi:hypothetical protein
VQKEVLTFFFNQNVKSNRKFPHFLIPSAVPEFLLVFPTLNQKLRKTILQSLRRDKFIYPWGAWFDS